MAGLTRDESGQFQAAGDKARLIVAANVVAALFGVQDPDVLIVRKRRVPAIQDARDAVVYVLQAIGVSYTRLAQQFKCSERAVMYAQKRCLSLMDDDWEYEALIKQAKKETLNTLSGEVSHAA